MHIVLVVVPTRPQYSASVGTVPANDRWGISRKGYRKHTGSIGSCSIHRRTNCATCGFGSSALQSK
jgi:hypothetical protein